MVTPLCTQLTYGGLIDELYGINNGIVQLDAALVQGDKAQKDGAAATRYVPLLVAVVCWLSSRLSHAVCRKARCH